MATVTRSTVQARLEIRGLQELDVMLTKLPDEIEGLILREALTRAGAVIRQAAQQNIRSKTGRTAADIVTAVYVRPAEHQGAAVTGGTRKKTGRSHILRWLEFGTKPHKIVAGASQRAQARRAAKALRAIGEKAAAKALRRAVREGKIGITQTLKLPNNVFRHIVNHPGIKPQAPLTRALADHGPRALKIFRETLWNGIVAASRRLPKAS